MYLINVCSGVTMEALEAEYQQMVKAGTVPVARIASCVRLSCDVGSAGREDNGEQHRIADVAQSIAQLGRVCSELDGRVRRRCSSIPATRCGM